MELEKVGFSRVRVGKKPIEKNWTEEGIAYKLFIAGVSQSEIMLAFHHL
ncbi:hypothetical protein FM036_35575 [Nostoc sp. HG1]|nr:hypothetical protein [Nostoc sp. HG1]